MSPIVSDIETIAVIDRCDTDGDDPPQFGKKEFLNALDEHGVAIEEGDYWTETAADLTVVVGYTDGHIVEKLIEGNVASPEAAVYQRASIDDHEALVVAGSDDRGLMYALLEMAERVHTRGLDAFKGIDRTVDTPDNKIRGIDRFIMGPVEDQWLYDEAFWHYYLRRLARNRFNRFVLIAGYDSAFMSPPYPFFVDVPGYQDVHVPDEHVDISREEHRETLRMIGRLCERYGLEFYFGIWQQRPNWRREQGDQGELVEGLPDSLEAFADYCTAGIERFLVEIPELDGLQLRINYEAGVGGSGYDSGSTIGPEDTTAEAFWRDIIAAVERASGARERELKLDLRAKGLTEDMIRWAQETGLNLTVPTKFWCENTGLPHHNTQMRREELAQLDDLNRSRRYGHSDLLRKPHYYDVLYRLWVIGTNRIFVWGDPDYARRFAHSTQFGDAIGFEVTAPLSLKGGHFHLQDEQWPLFDDPDLRDYEYEDERYWAWYRLFGRLGFSADADADIWRREFKRRFGPAADPLREGYRHASKILPLLTAAHLTEHPATINWVELDTGGALFTGNNVNEKFGYREYYDGTYQDVEPSDPGLFYGINEYVEDVLADEREPKYTPLQVARWYRRLAADTRAAVEQAEEQIKTATGEFDATVLDFRMLADLTEYHAEKTEAALALSFYQHGEDPSCLVTAHDRMRRARDIWATLAERGEGTYHSDLVFGMGPESTDEGQWNNRLPELEADLEDLQSLIEETGADPEAAPSVGQASDAPSFTPPSFDMTIPKAVTAGEAVEITVRTGELNPHRGLTLHYCHTDQTESQFKQVQMERTADGYEASIPGDYVMEEWDLQVYLSAIDESGDTLLYPGLYAADEPAPYVTVIVVPE